MENLENQLNKLSITEKSSLNTFIDFINTKYPQKEYPIIVNKPIVLCLPLFTKLG